MLDTQMARCAKWYMISHPEENHEVRAKRHLAGHRSSESFATPSFRPLKSICHVPTVGMDSATRRIDLVWELIRDQKHKSGEGVGEGCREGVVTAGKSRYTVATKDDATAEGNRGETIMWREAKHLNW